MSRVCGRMEVVKPHCCWVEYNPKGHKVTIEEVASFLSQSPRRNDKTTTAKAIRWHFFPDPSLLEDLQAQSIPTKTEKFMDFVYDTNNHTLLSKGYWLLRRVFDKDDSSLCRLRKVENLGEE